MPQFRDIVCGVTSRLSKQGHALCATACFLRVRCRFPAISVSKAVALKLIAKGAYTGPSLPADVLLQSHSTIADQVHVVVCSMRCLHAIVHTLRVLPTPRPFALSM